MLRKAPCCGPYEWPAVVPRTMRGDTFVTMSLSSANVLVTAKPQPCSNERRIMAEAVVGGADASPYGFSNLMPHSSTEMSTSSMAEWKSGSAGGVSNGRFWRMETQIVQIKNVPVLNWHLCVSFWTISSRFVVCGTCK